MCVCSSRSPRLVERPATEQQQATFRHRSSQPSCVADAAASKRRRARDGSAARDARRTSGAPRAEAEVEDAAERQHAERAQIRSGRELPASTTHSKSPTTGVHAGVRKTPAAGAGSLRFRRSSPTCSTENTHSKSRLVVCARICTPPDTASPTASAKATSTATHGVARTGWIRVKTGGSSPSRAMPYVKRDAMMRFRSPVLQMANSATIENAPPGGSTPAARSTSSSGACELASSATGKVSSAATVMPT